MSGISFLKKLFFCAILLFVRHSRGFGPSVSSGVGVGSGTKDNTTQHFTHNEPRWCLQQHFTHTHVCVWKKGHLNRFFRKKRKTEYFYSGKKPEAKKMKGLKWGRSADIRAMPHSERGHQSNAAQWARTSEQCRTVLGLLCERGGESNATKKALLLPLLIL